ncbi:MAG: tRNA (adenosine(37)-N6)-threonylcarbamoyltransferase complex dimerization subunit type 1 TsaB [Kiritimatiellia bacterium]
MLLLAIEQSSDSAGLALFKDGLIAGQRAWDAAESRSNGLFIHLRALLAETGFSLSDVAHYAVDVGPGSYGGLRSSLAAALAFAMPSDTPVYAVTAPEIIAFGAMREFKTDLVQVVGDARRAQLWTCTYAAGCKMPALREKLELVQAAGFRPAPGATVVSPDWHRLAGILEPAEARVIRLVKKRILPSAVQLGELVLRRLELNMPGEPLRPVYLHEAVAGSQKSVDRMQAVYNSQAGGCLTAGRCVEPGSQEETLNLKP